MLFSAAAPRLAAAAVATTLACMEPRAALAAAPALVDCGAGAACKNVDFGTCGNACCAVDFRLKATSDASVKALRAVLRDGGPDGQFSLPPLEGGRAGFTDLRRFNAPADFIGQAVHTTSARNFQDTINFAVRNDKVRAFSISSCFLHIFHWRCAR